MTVVRDQKIAGSGDMVLREALATAIEADSASSSTATTNLSTPDLEAVSNTRWFLLEKNENFTLTSQMAEDAEIQDIVDPSNPPTRGCNARYIRWVALHFLVQQLPFRILTMLLILIDIILIVIDLIIDCPTDVSSRTMSLTDLVISVYFVLEIAIRMFALKPRVFFRRKHWFNIVDFVIVLVTFVISVAYTIVVELAVAEGADCWQEHLDNDDAIKDTLAQTDADNVLTVMRILVAIRFVRLFRLARFIRLYTEHHQLKRAIRQKVSQNKRRYQNDGIDLDLTYVTKRIIAMSFPSQGLRAWYRNPIREVVAFLDRYHGDHYRVYNLCSERTYEDSWFHNRVRHWPIDDHNVPSVAEMIDFVKEVDEWLRSDDRHVVAVHCKGGKGRTGTMICILLVYFDLFSNADMSLEYFGQRRTDKNVSKRFQGVETASQIRYVNYFESVMKTHAMTLPDPVWAEILSIKIAGISFIGKGNGQDLALKVSMGKVDSHFVADFSNTEHRDRFRLTHDVAQDTIYITLNKCPKVVKDVRLKFFCTSGSVPKGYEKCAFYFWFNTAFVTASASSGEGSEVHEASSSMRRLKLSREEVDNAHKEKTWRVFRQEFSVEIVLRVG